MRGTTKKLLNHLIYNPALVFIKPAKRATEQMDPQFNGFAESQPFDGFFFYQEGGLFTVIYNFLQIAHS